MSLLDWLGVCLGLFLGFAICLWFDRRKAGRDGNPR